MVKLTEKIFDFRRPKEYCRLGSRFAFGVFRHFISIPPHSCPIDACDVSLWRPENRPAETRLREQLKKRNTTNMRMRRENEVNRSCDRGRATTDYRSRHGIYRVHIYTRISIVLIDVHGGGEVNSCRRHARVRPGGGVVAGDKNTMIRHGVSAITCTTCARSTRCDVTVAAAGKRSASTAWRLNLFVSLRLIVRQDAERGLFLREPKQKYAYGTCAATAAAGKRENVINRNTLIR